MRFIKLDENNKVISIRYGKSIVEEEIQSDLGELGQIMQSDGTFIDDQTPQPDSVPSLQEQIYAESLYQTALLEMQQMLGGI